MYNGISKLLEEKRKTMDKATIILLDRIKLRKMKKGENYGKRQKQN